MGDELYNVILTTDISALNEQTTPQIALSVKGDYLLQLVRIVGKQCDIVIERSR